VKGRKGPRPRLALQNLKTLIFTHFGKPLPQHSPLEREMDWEGEPSQKKAKASATSSAEELKRLDEIVARAQR
jgi:hypothetical protein